MKVVQINTCDYGSTGKIARAIHQEALRNGYDSYFGYGLGSCDEINTFPISNQFDFRFHTYMSRITGLHGYYSKAKTKCLLEKLDSIAPDIVHLHNIHGGYIHVGILLEYLKERNIRTLLTLHDCWPFTGGCPHFHVARCEKWRTECERCSQLSVYPKSYFFDTSRRCFLDKRKWFGGFNNLRVVAVSNWLRNQARESFLNEYSIETVYNGIDVDVFKPVHEDIRSKYNITNTNPIIIGVASVWDPRKRMDLFLKLHEELKHEANIVLVGLSQTQIENLPDGVIGINRTENQDELVKLYSSAELFINFSQEETFGLVAVEAMACGTPVLVSNSTACPEVVSNETGYVMDIENFSQILEIVRNHIGNKKKMENSCICRVRQCFAERIMVQNYMQIYETMMR